MTADPATPSDPEPDTQPDAGFASTLRGDPFAAPATEMANPWLDDTHAPELKSWVASANSGHTDFPIQNLPYGRFRRRKSDEPWRIGVAIGDQILDLHLAATQCPWPEQIEELLQPLAAGDLNVHMALGPKAWRLLRHALSIALAEGSDQGPFLELCLVPQAQAELSLPCRIAEYTDFQSGIHHAVGVGRLLRPDQPLLPNYKWVPIAHPGRASSVVASGHPVKRPHGQIKGPGADGPVFGPSQRLEFELEVGALVGPGSSLGEPVAIDDTARQLFGMVLLNDWTARDLQAWEAQPLGPFVSKNFATTLSPWVVTFDALAPFRRPFVRAPGDPAPLAYLDSALNRAFGSFDITASVWLQTARMRAAGEPAVQLTEVGFAEAAYWTPAQWVAHHTVGGCPLRTGDLLGSGALSGAQPLRAGSLMELTVGGKRPLTLPDGETRGFLQTGDTVVLAAYCAAEGAVPIGFGRAVGTIVD